MVTVIITTFGGSPKLERAIQSVLEQTFKDVEVIVVDDNNPDSPQRKYTETLMQKFSGNNKVKYIKHTKNKNGAMARNTGIKAALGEYIAFLDDDDFYLPERIEVSIGILQKDQTLDGVCTAIAFVEEKYITGISIKEQNSELTVDNLLTDQMAIGTGSNIFLRRDLIDKITGFDAEFQRFQDIEFMLRASECGKIVFIDKVLIVKDRSDVRTPNYVKVRDALNVFERKFSKKIDSLSPVDRNEYYINRHKALYLFSKLSCNFKYIQEAGNFLKRDKNIGIKTNIEIRLPNLIWVYWCVKSALKKGLLLGKHTRKTEKRRRNSEKANYSILGEETYSRIKRLLDMDNEVLSDKA